MPFCATIVETLLPDWPLLDRAARDHVGARVASYVAKAIDLAPLHVRGGVAVLSLAMGAVLTLLNLGAGGPLVRARRAACFYALLQRLPGPASSVVRLYRSMTLLAFYEQPEVAGLLGPGKSAR